jgi:YVTN family beta-propeller protein
MKFLAVILGLGRGYIALAAGYEISGRRVEGAAELDEAPIRGRSVFGAGLVALVLLAGAFVGNAQAQTVYVANGIGETVTAFDSETLVAAPAIPTASVAAEVAISPDGRTAYVTGYSTGEVLMLDTATDAVTGSIPGFGAPVAIAISPDGGTLYVSDAQSQTIITASTATDAITGSPIVAGGWATGLAVSPDGATVYASVPDGDEVVPIDAATRAVGVPIEVGDEPDHLAITPDGSKLYVPNSNSGSVSVIDTASEAVINEVEVGLYPERVVPSPNGGRVYVVDHGYGQISVIDTATDEVLGQPTPVVEAPNGAAITADGSRLLVVGVEPTRAEAIDTATMTPVGAPPIELDGYPEGIAIVPAQTPVPEFSAVAATAGVATTFDAAASHTYDGRITRYNWDFGDGTSAADAGPAPTHVYATRGTYRVTLTVSNGQGCPGFVFTGKTAICAGPSVASVSEQVGVDGPTADAVGPTAIPLGAVAGPRSVRVRCPARAKRAGCRFKLQLVSGRPKKLANGKLKKPKPESAVAKLTLSAGKSAPVVLRPRPKFAARVASQSRVFVKRTRVIHGRTRTDFPRLAFVG